VGMHCRRGNYFETKCIIPIPIIAKINLIANAQNGAHGAHGPRRTSNHNRTHSCVTLALRRSSFNIPCLLSPFFAFRLLTLFAIAFFRFSLF
jgi:hypothetical protein